MPVPTLAAESLRAADEPPVLASLPDALRILVVVVAILAIVGKRLYGEPMTARRVLILPVVFVAVGALDFAQNAPAHPSRVAVVMLVVAGLVSLFLGAVRGATIEVTIRDGFLYQRYRLATLGVWLVYIGVRVATVAVGHVWGASAVVSASLLLMLGLTLLGEAGAVVPRALASGASFAPHSRGTRLGTFGAADSGGPRTGGRLDNGRPWSSRRGGGGRLGGGSRLGGRRR